MIKEENREAQLNQTLGSSEKATKGHELTFLTFEILTDLRRVGTRREVRAAASRWTWQHGHARTKARDRRRAVVKPRTLLPAQVDHGRGRCHSSSWMGTMMHHVTSLGLSSQQRSLSEGAAAARARLLDNTTGVIEVSLGHLRTDLYSVLACYEKIVEFQGQFFEQDMAKIKRRADVYLRYISCDPVSVIAAVLGTVHHLRSSPNWAVQQNEDQHVLVLKQVLIHEINKALENPARQITFQVIWAVGLLSAFELNSGAVQSWHVHMRGVMQMIHLRGGLAQMGMEAIWLKWLISNTAKIAQCDTYWSLAQSSESNPMGIPDPDKRLFQLVDLRGKVNAQKRVDTKTTARSNLPEDQQTDSDAKFCKKPASTSRQVCENCAMVCPLLTSKEDMMRSTTSLPCVCIEMRCNDVWDKVVGILSLCKPAIGGKSRRQAHTARQSRMLGCQEVMSYGLRSF